MFSYNQNKIRKNYTNTSTSTYVHTHTYTHTPHLHKKRKSLLKILNACCLIKEERIFFSNNILLPYFIEVKAQRIKMLNMFEELEKNIYIYFFCDKQRDSVLFMVRIS